MNTPSEALGLRADAILRFMRGGLRILVDYFISVLNSFSGRRNHCFLVAICTSLWRSISLESLAWAESLSLSQRLHVDVMSHHLLNSPAVCSCVPRYRCATNLETDA